MAEKPPAEGKSNDAPPNADTISKKVKEDVNKQSKEEKRAEKKAIDEICRRQAKLEAKEIKQTWNIVFGNVKPKKKKEIYKIDGITLRNIWLEPLFIFNKIVNLFPQERFHPVKSYALQWQAPGNSYRMIVPLEDPVVQERTVMNISWYPKVQQKRILFFFAPIDPLMTMFAPSIHPASLVSYRSKVAVLHKLCDLYVQHKISLDEFQKIMGCNYDIWCVTLYNLLPEDAQPFHTYLLHPPPVVVDKQSLEKKYLHELINLNEYNDLKFPDRTKKREEESKTYPLPYATAQCVICKDMDTGIIKCQNCGNMVCVPCVHREFLDPVTRTGSFLLMHRKFCLRLGSCYALSF